MPSFHATGVKRVGRSIPDLRATYEGKNDICCFSRQVIFTEKHVFTAAEILAQISFLTCTEIWSDIFYEESSEPGAVQRPVRKH